MMTQDILRKIELLCFGLKSNDLVEQIYDKQNPYDLTRTGNVGLQLMIGERKLIANVPVFNKFTEDSPLCLMKKDDGFYVNNLVSGETYPFEIVQTPNWYTKNVGNNRSAGQYVLREGVSTLICSISDSCGYVPSKQQCKFCAIGSNASNFNESVQERKNNILQAISYALKDEQELETSINLTGGNTGANDRGAGRYIDYVREIRKFSEIPICIEFSPPENNDSILALKDAGVNAVMMNIEVWDENIRAMIMPGKSQISRNRYITAWEYAIKVFGSGNVSSVLIVGLENKQSAKSAIDEMVKHGVIPSIMPFRPNDGAALENYPITNPKMVCELTEYAAKKIQEARIATHNIPGCIGCGACATELDLVNFKG